MSILSLFLNEKLHFFFFSICFVQFGSLELWKNIVQDFPFWVELTSAVLGMHLEGRL